MIAGAGEVVPGQANVTEQAVVEPAQVVQVLTREPRFRPPSACSPGRRSNPLAELSEAIEDTALFITRRRQCIAVGYDCHVYLQKRHAGAADVEAAAQRNTGGSPAFDDC